MISCLEADESAAISVWTRREDVTEAILEVAILITVCMTWSEKPDLS